MPSKRKLLALATKEELVYVAFRMPATVFDLAVKGFERERKARPFERYTKADHYRKIFARGLEGIDKHQ